MKRIFLMIMAIIVLVPAGILATQYLHDPGSNELSAPVTDAAQQVARGNYLVRAGDCMACHTARGGQPFAGGRVIPTPFGDLYSPNITSDVATGIGSWTANDFWRALHNGKSKDGSFLYPAFPYTEYTKVTRTDADAMFAYFQTLPAVKQPNKEQALRFPYNQRILLAGWRALYFSPGVYQPDRRQSAEWNRGAYFVQGLGHCIACHTTRNTFGASEGIGLAGGLIPTLGWYAPSLTSDAEAGLGNWDKQHIVDLLKTGTSPRGTVFGPMAEVVRQSLQHLTDEDVGAMAGYLQSLPHTSPPAAVREMQVKGSQAEDVLKLGAKLYRDYCIECHKASGSGIPPAYPPLAGNRAITMQSSINPIRMVLNGGYPPSTEGNPRPYGMPPFGPVLTDVEVAAVVSYIRSSWGNNAALVSPVQVSRYRAVPE
ncbi:cytochrome c [Glaciimonas sp. PCH181]|uniref:c-type cytochrome n=1 Tax=Glaciimonas sp. PCH181 TaxID=2133943 RepID=UPI000D38A243|nr:cytochrome c [Glaciimonas sp. PCH181]PUA19313.1 alcohol dehydrogenase [Glaciimonas sp. PCH181]